MKKRLLALILCLALAMSLLPVTAFALTDDDIVGIQDQGVYCGATYFTISAPSDVTLYDFYWMPVSGSIFVQLYPDNLGRYKLAADFGTGYLYFSIDDTIPHSTWGFIALTINQGHDWSDWTSNGDGTHSRTCGNGCVDSPQTEPCADTSPADCKCDDCEASMHTWQFKAAGNTLRGTCNHSYCPTKEISVSLKADSVTLPTSPFNARLEGLEQFKKEVPNAVIGEFVYKYKGPGDSEYRIVEPTAANAKAGEYQVGVRIKNLPGTVAQEGPVAMAHEGNQDNTGYADLYVQYTAADPAITAQTGDNRPIELMMASVLDFSALAAAAFVLDGKRKYRQ